MASALIHLAVAKNLLKDLKVENEKDYLLGSIAPDLAKQIGTSRIDSHFLIHTKEDVPNIIIITQADYDELEASGNEDPNVYYLISDEIYYN